MAAAQRRYRERHRDRVAESKKRYQERHEDRVAEAQKRYRESHRAQLQAYQRRYEETHRGRYTTDKYRARRRKYLANKRKRDQEKKRKVEKFNALGPLKLTITLTDYLKSPSGRTPVTTYVKAFCDSLESLSVDTNVSPAESFLQLLENDSHTLIDLDSGAIQVLEPPECDFDDFSFLQDISSDEWTDLLGDVEDSSFDLEALVPPEGIVDLLEDMSPDEGIDLMYDLVT